MNDLISRQAAIDALCAVCGKSCDKSEFVYNAPQDEQVILSPEHYVLCTLPSAQPEINCSEIPNNSDTISRQAAIDAIENTDWYHQNANKDMVSGANPDMHQAWYKAEDVYKALESVPSAQPEIIRCKDCIYYDPPHVENNGVRYEYDEMQADAFDALGTGLVSAEYGINIGGRCCVDYYCKNYSDDKRVFVREDNYCGRAERRTDEQ